MRSGPRRINLSRDDGVMSMGGVVLEGSLVMLGGGLGLAADTELVKTLSLLELFMWRPGLEISRLELIRWRPGLEISLLPGFH